MSSGGTFTVVGAGHIASVDVYYLDGVLVDGSVSAGDVLVHAAGSSVLSIAVRSTALISHRRADGLVTLVVERPAVPIESLIGTRLRTHKAP